MLKITCFSTRLLANNIVREWEEARITGPDVDSKDIRAQDAVATVASTMMSQIGLLRAASPETVEL